MRPSLLVLLCSGGVPREYGGDSTDAQCCFVWVCGNEGSDGVRVSGNAVEDMHAYRQYHGLDKAIGYLLQYLIVEEPGDPVQALISKMEEMPKLAKLRKELPDKPYWGNLKSSA